MDTGVDTGVAVRMKVEIPHLVDIHCVAHQLEFGILDAIKHDRELEKAKELLQGIYRHHFSTKAVRELKEIAAALEETVKKPVNILGTRWSQLYMKGSDALQAMIARSPPSLARFTEEVDGGGDEWQEVHFRRRDGDMECFNNKKASWVNSVLAYCEARFENLTSNPVLAAATNFDPATWPEDMAELSTHGDQQLNTLLRHFQAVLATQDFSENEAKREWLTVKVEIRGNHQCLRRSALWQRFLTDPELSEQFRNILFVAGIVLMFPVSTACCERGFSVMKHIKSDWRSCLNTDTLDDLLRISLSGVSVCDYDTVRAVNQWWNSAERARRPELHD